jgi:hypothetical protein
MGELVEVLIDASGVEVLEGCPGDGVKPRALGLGYAGIGHLLRERVLEYVHRARLLVEELPGDKVPELGDQHVGRPVRDDSQQLHGYLAPDHCRPFEDPAQLGG